MERNSSGAARAWRLRRPRHIGSSYDSLKLLALHHARLLSRSGAAAFGRGTADDAACGRAGASGAAAAFLSMRVCRRSRAVRLPSGLRVLFSQLLFCLVHVTQSPCPLKDAQAFQLALRSSM